MNVEQDHLLIIRGSRAGEEIPLSTLHLIIDRLEPADVVINKQNVSRKHARISRREAGHFVEDLTSSNGTFVNGKRE